jgi:hypothetical protein
LICRVLSYTVSFYSIKAWWGSLFKARDKTVCVRKVDMPSLIQHGNNTDTYVWVVCCWLWI